MRSVSQIYSEIVTARNNYLQLTELNSGRSNSKLSILNLLTYIMSVCIHTYEAILDLFQVEMVKVLNGRVNGTPDWYAIMARKFQFNPVTGVGDELKFNENNLKIEYVNPDTSHRVVEKAAWQMSEQGNSLILKVCKANTNSNEVDSGIPYMPLTDQELTAFKMYIQQIKFVGAEIYSESYPGDIVRVVADKNSPIFFNDSYVTASQALSEIQKAMVDFANEQEFNGYLYYQSILDAIRKVEHVSDVGTLKIYVRQYNSSVGAYGEPIRLSGRMRLKSGYIRLLDENSVNVINNENLTLIPVSKMDDYVTSSPNDCDCDCECGCCK